MRHPHADLIIAWVEDTSRVVQYESKSDGEWIDEPEPKFHPSWNWRFKPEKNLDRVEYWWRPSHGDYPHTKLKTKEGANLKLTFDGETGKLKSAEVIQ